MTLCTEKPKECFENYEVDSTFNSGQGSTVYSDSQSSQQSVVLGSLADAAPLAAQSVCSPPVSAGEGPVLSHSLPSLGAHQQPATPGLSVGSVPPPTRTSLPPQHFPEPATSFAPVLTGPTLPMPSGHQPPPLAQPAPLPQVLAPKPVGPLQPVPPHLPPYLPPTSQVAPVQPKSVQMPPAPLQPLTQVLPQMPPLPVIPPLAPLAAIDSLPAALPDLPAASGPAVPPPSQYFSPAVILPSLPLGAAGPASGVAALSIHPAMAPLPAQPIYQAAFPQMVPGDIPPSPLHTAQTVRATPLQPAPPVLPQPHQPSVAHLPEQTASAPTVGSQILLGHPPPCAVDVPAQVPAVPAPAAVLSPPPPSPHLRPKCCRPAPPSSRLSPPVPWPPRCWLLLRAGLSRPPRCHLLACRCPGGLGPPAPAQPSS
ncbi:serine/threonine-protein kinase WNK2-like [Molossus nigricans]